VFLLRKHGKLFGTREHENVWAYVVIGAFEGKLERSPELGLAGLESKTVSEIVYQVSLAADSARIAVNVLDNVSGLPVITTRPKT
jgi:hypothetical protein